MKKNLGRKEKSKEEQQLKVETELQIHKQAACLYINQKALIHPAVTQTTRT